MSVPEKFLAKVESLIKEVPVLTGNRNRVGQITDAGEIAKCRG